MMSKIKIALAASVAAVALAGPAKAEGIKVGFLGGMTGPIESLVPPIADGAQLALRHVNDNGGVLGGQNLELVIADTTCADATKASDAADRLVNVEKVAAIIGALCSGATIASANNAGIPGGVAMISPASTSPALSKLEDNDLVFRTAPSDAYQGQVLAKLINDQGVKDIAITYVNNDYGKGFSAALEEAFSGMGGTVSANEAHEDNKADYRSEIGSVASSGAEALVIIGYADGSGRTILQQTLESGDFDKFYTGDGMVSDDLAEQVGSQLNGKMTMTLPGKEDVPGAEIFNNLATEAGIKIDGPFVPNSYDAAFILALAMEKAGSADRAAIAGAVRDVAMAPGEVILPGEWAKAVEAIKAGKDINYEGAIGAHEFDEVGDIPGVFIESEIMDGKIVRKGIVK